MNKRSIRSFALGILLSISLIGIFYFSEEKNSAQEPINEQEAKSFLEGKGFIILPKEQYNELKSSVDEAKKAENKFKAKQESKQKDVEEATDNDTTMKLEIISGMVSHDIAKVLEKNNIIDDAEQFAIYLEENGYSTRIQLGVFELKTGMSYKDIAKIITKS